MAITGPFEATGVSETPSRRKIFACHPQSPAQQTQCAHTIVTALASQAFRRTATERDVNALMALYREGAAEGGFEDGVRMALEGILASPRFVFRFEERPANVAARRRLCAQRRRPGVAALVLPVGAAPGCGVAARGRGRPAVASRRARAPGDAGCSPIAAPTCWPRASPSQWLRLQDLDKINPDVRFYPDFDEQLKGAMRRETEAFFQHIVRSQPAGAGPVHRRLHLRGRAARPALRHSRHHRRRDASGDVSGHDSAAACWATPASSP